MFDVELLAVKNRREGNAMTGTHDHTHPTTITATRSAGSTTECASFPQPARPNVPSTPGMDRKGRDHFARARRAKTVAGTVTISRRQRTGAHHHRHLESIILFVKGRARMRWASSLQSPRKPAPGDFIFVPPYVPHQEINASRDEVLECVLVRSAGQAVGRSISISSRSKSRKPCCGSIRCTRSRGGEVTQSSGGASANPESGDSGSGPSDITGMT